MNEFIRQYDDLVESHGISEDQELELIKHILSESEHTSTEEFAKSYITSEDAIDLVFSNERAIADYLEYNPLNHQHIVDAITEHPEQFAYTIAYKYPLLGTELIEELLYYRSKGRL